MAQMPDMDGRLYYAVKETRGRLPTTAYELKSPFLYCSSNINCKFMEDEWIWKF